jgi:hypothetical protein
MWQSHRLTATGHSEAQPSTLVLRKISGSNSMELLNPDRSKQGNPSPRAGTDRSKQGNQSARAETATKVTAPDTKHQRSNSPSALLPQRRTTVLDPPISTFPVQFDSMTGLNRYALQERRPSLTDRVRNGLLAFVAPCTGSRGGMSSSDFNALPRGMRIRVRTDPSGRQLVSMDYSGDDEYSSAASVDDASVMSTESAVSSLLSVDSIMSALKQRPVVVRGHQSTVEDEFLDEMSLVLKRFQKALRRVPAPLAQRYQFSALLGWGGNGFVAEAIDRSNLSAKVCLLITVI